ncbi:MAG: hypothetical protein AAFY88_24390, partial [Acidobacteriota bacterium]
MDLERAKRFHTLLEQLLALEPGEHAAFLDNACGDDPSLRRDLEQALAAEAEALDVFLEPPTFASTADRPRPPSSAAIARPATAELTATSVQRRLLASGAAPLFLGLSILMLALVAAAAHGTWLLLSGVDPHFSFGSWSGTLHFVDSEVWPELAPGDSIAGVDGVEVEGRPAEIRRALLGIKPGEVAAIEVRRHGSGEALVRSKALLESYSAIEKVVGWSRLVIGGLLVVIALGALALRPEHAAARLLLRLCVSLAGYLLIYLALFPFPREALLFEKLCLYFTVGASLHLYAAYPRRLFATRWTPVFYGPFALACAIAVLYRSPLKDLASDVLRHAPHVAALAA